MSGAAVSGRRIAISNRGEIAVRIAATCRRLGAVPIVLLGDPDLEGYAARTIGRVERIGPAGSELDVVSVIAAATRAGADLLHPRYGFLSERIWPMPARRLGLPLSDRQRRRYAFAATSWRRGRPLSGPEHRCWPAAHP